MKNLDFLENACLLRLEELKGWQEKAEKSLKKAPEGKLILSGCKGTVQYYQKKSHTEAKGTYIQKKNQKLIRALAQKDYDLIFNKEIEKQKEKFTHILKLLPREDIDQIYASLPAERKQFVRPYVLPDEQYIEEWEQVEYSGKDFFEETPVHITERGERVRSKSEKILADKLYTMKIPYRYEYPLYLDGFGTVYPDFTLLNVYRREEVYLEHFGMMDNPEYSQKVVAKLQTYARNHIYPGKNLILTFETLQMPLDMRSVEEMLEIVLLQ